MLLQAIDEPDTVIAAVCVPLVAICLIFSCQEPSTSLGTNSLVKTV